MTEPLGLSIGMTNLVAARVGRPPVMRRSSSTSSPTAHPKSACRPRSPDFTGARLVLSGFVERVGDPVPLVAADGSAHRGEVVLAEALDAMARTVDGGSPIAIAVPAHWGPGTVGALRGALRSKPEPGTQRRARRADPRLGRRAVGAAGRAGTARPGRRRAGRPRRQRIQHHAGRRRREPRRGRPDGPLPGVLRRRDRPGAAQPRARRDRRREQRRPRGHRGGRVAGPAARRVPDGQGTPVRRDRHGGARRTPRVPLRRPA